MRKEYEQAFATLEGWVPEPVGGLPEEFFGFVSRFTPIVNVDLLIQDEALGTLLTWRQDETYGAGWHVPGGIIRYRQTIEECIRATALREVGAAVTFDPGPVAIEQFIEPNRRHRGHFISMLYRCRLLGPPDPALRYVQGEPRKDEWAWHAGCPPDLLEMHLRYCKFFSLP